MSYEPVLLPKFSSDGTIILAKEQVHNSYTFWAMPILIFSPFANFGKQSLRLIFWFLNFVDWNLFESIGIFYKVLFESFRLWPSTFELRRLSCTTLVRISIFVQKLRGIFFHFKRVHCKLTCNQRTFSVYFLLFPYPKNFSQFFSSHWKK